MKRFLTVFVTALLVCLVTTNLWAAPPLTQARSLGYTLVTTSGAKATWINGNGMGRFVVVAFDTDGSDSPDWNGFETGYGLDSKTLADVTDAGGNYATADSDNDNKYTDANGVKYVVIDRMTGTARTSTFTNLPTPNKTYTVHIFEYNTDGDGTASFNLANNATQNPRSFTTTAGLAAPAWAGSPVTTTQNTNTVVLDWESSATATGYVINVSTDTGANFDGNRLADYTDLDVGSDTGWDLYLPIAGTYYVTVYAYNNSEESDYNAEQTITINVSMPPKFLDGDTPSLTTETGVNAGNFTVTLTFDQGLWNTGNESGALETSDFAAYAPVTGTNASAKVVIQAISHNAGDNIVTLTLRFNDRVTTTDKFRIGPANAASVYGEIISPSATGIPMDINLDGTKGGQYSADITCPDASVLNITLNPDVAFTTINLAAASSLTSNGDNLQLKNNKTYDEDINLGGKGFVLTDETAGNDNDNAIFKGKFQINSAAYTISGIDLLGRAADSYIVGITGTTGITIQNCDISTLNNDSGSSLIQLVNTTQVPTITISGNTFDMSNATFGIYLSGTTAITEISNLSIQGNTFNNINNSADKCIVLRANQVDTYEIDAVNIANNTFSAGTAAGDAIYFEKNNGGLTDEILAVYIHNNTFNNTGYAIAFESGLNFTTHLPVIDLYDDVNTSFNTFHANNLGVTTKYVYSHSTLANSRFLYPGIAVLGLEDASTLEGGTAQEYHTVAAAIAASDDDGSQSVFLGQGTYTDNISINEAVNLVGKDADATTGTVLTGNLVIEKNSAADFSVSDIYFDPANTTSVEIRVTPDANTLTITNCDFNYIESETGIFFSDGTLAGNVTITSNTFKKSYGLAASSGTPAVKILNSQVTGTVTFSDNNFQFNSTGTKDIGIYISTTNNTGISNGTIAITGNTFAAASAPNYNGVGDAIVFEEFVNNANSLSGAAINIYNGNDFSQVGYGIKIAEGGTYAGSIHTTLPAIIDLNSASNDTGDNNNLTAADIYGAAWYSLAGTGANDLLYPSVQTAETADLAATLYIGEGTYAEDVTFSGGTNLTTIDGEGATCELASANRVTLENDYAFSGFSATLITVGDDDVATTEGNIDDAMDIIKTDGTISIAADAVIGGGTVDKKVTITDAGVGGAIDGTLLVTVSGGDITNLDLTGNPAITINLTNGCSASTGISGNAFTLANGGDGVLVQTGNANSAGTFPLNIVGNSFAGGDADSKAINFRNQTAGFATFSAVNVYNTNDFNTPGYDIYRTNEGSICTYLPSVTVKGTTANTYTTPTLFGFYYSPLPIDGTTETIYTDCAAPAAFAVGSVTTVTNAVAGYWNGDNTAVTVRVPVDVTDNSLVNGTIQLRLQVNAFGWVNLDAPVTITSADKTAGYKDITVTKATLEGADAGNVAEGRRFYFTAIITDMGGQSTTGTPSGTSLFIDRVDPVITLVSATANNIINIAEKAAGFNVVVSSNENNTRIWATLTDGGGYGFAYVDAATAATNYNIVIPPNSGYIEEQYNPFYAHGYDEAGNMSLASVGTFLVDLTAPADFTVGTVDVPGEFKNGYYNKADHDANLSVTVVVPVANDASLTGGTIQVRAKIGAGGTYENVGITHTILNGELGTNVTITLTRTQFEGITGLAEGNEVYFTAVITDLAGNPTTGTASVNTLIFDIVPPAATTIASRTTVTAPVVANYFNDDNTAVTATINIPNDPTLVGGNVKLQARINANGFVDVAATTNAIPTANTTQNITVQKSGTGNTDLDELTDWASGTTLDFRAILTDAAGNSFDGTTFAPTMNVDLADPAAPVFTLNGGNCINENNQTTVLFTVIGEANATVNWTLADAGNAHTLTSSVNLGVGGSAVVINQDLSSFNDGVITVSGTQTDLAGNVSVSGNDTETKNTDDAGITTLTLTSNNFLNMYAKNGQTLTLAIDADEDVTVTAATIEGNNVLPSLTAGGDGSQWSLTWTVVGMTTDDTGEFSITLQDGCGNNVTYTQTALTGTNVTYDNTAPSVTGIVRHNPSGQFTNVDNPVFRVTFSEPVEITNTNVFTFSGTCTGTPAVQSATGAAGQMGATALYTTWDVTIEGIANENGTLELELDANLTNVRDKASNNPAAYTDGQSYTIDNILPVVTVTTPSYDGSRIQALAQLQGTYSDANGVTAGNVKVSIFRDDNNDGIFNGTDQYWNGTAFASATEQKHNANRTPPVDLGSNWTYNINLTGYLAETAFKMTVYATDVAANESNATRRFVVDPIPPKVVSLTKTDNNTLVVTFDEGMDENWTNVPPGLEGNGDASFYAVSGTVNGTPFGPINPTAATRQGNQTDVVLDFADTPFQGILQCETLSILVTGVHDIAGNTVDPLFDEATYTEPDVTAPYVVSINRLTPEALPSPYLTNASQVVFRVTLSEAVQNVSVQDFFLSVNDEASGAIASVIAVSTSVYDVTVNVDATSDGGTLTVIIDDEENNITDIQCAPGSPNNAFNQGANPLTPQTYTVDRKAPVIAAGFLTAPLTGAYWNEGIHNITWDDTKVSDGYSMDVNTKLTFEYSILGDFTDADDVTPTTEALVTPTTSLTWNVDLPDTTSVNTAKVRVKATDEAGNISNWYAGTAFVLDNVAPTATITITPNNAPLNNYKVNNATTSVTIDADFSENMDQVLAPTLALNPDLDGILNDEEPTSAAWQSATKYRWVLEINALGQYKLDNTIDVTGAKDLAQNTMEPAELDSVKVDQVLPFVSNLTTGQNLYNKSDDEENTTFTVVFSEDMEDDNFPTFGFYQYDSEQELWSSVDLDDVFGEGSTDWTNTTTFVWTSPVTDDSTTEKYDNILSYVNGATDLAGNPAAQAYDVYTFDVDMAAPMIAWHNAYQSTTGVNPLDKNDRFVKNGDFVYYEITSNEQLTNLSVNSLKAEFNGENHVGGENWFLSYTNEEEVDIYGFYGIVSNANYPTDGNMSYRFQVTDPYGNPSNEIYGNAINLAASQPVVVDRTPPTLTITRGNVTLGDNTNKVTTDPSVTFNLDFSEPLLNFALADITINASGTVTTDAIVDCTLNEPDGNNDYTLTVTNVAGDGALGITVNKANFTDRAENLMVDDVTSATFTIDNTAPIVSNVESNCHNDPIDGYTFNQAARVTFSEGVYTNSNASGALVAGDLNITASGGNASLQSWGFLSHTAGNTQLTITTSWNGTVLGNEQLRAAAFNGTSIYDQAGNALAVQGTNVGGPNPPKNWDYAKVQIAILTQPTNQSTCETGSVQFTTSAQGGLSVVYQWQYYYGDDWVNLSNGALDGATFSNVTTSQMTVTNPNSTNWNGKQFRCYITNDCESKQTSIVTLTVNPDTYIAEDPADTEACFAAVDNDLTVTAGGHPPITYQWQYSADGINGWANVVNGTPANATYSGATLATLNIQGNIAVGTYYYRVEVGSECGDDVTSEVASLTVNPLPNAGLTVGGTTTICQGSSTNITVALSQVGVNYQLRNNTGNVNVGTPVAGTGGTINLPTGNLSSTTTFNVLATNATTSCSAQLSQTATVTVEPTPVNPTLASKTPNQATVCQGSQVSATFTAGSGGNGTDSYQYSLDNGGSWNAYTPGNNITAGTQTILIQGRRNAAVCGTSWTTLANWNVELTPVAGAITKNPNTAAVCVGDIVSATFGAGSGGNGTDTYEYRFDGTGGWSAYTSGNPLSTTGHTQVEIRSTRNAAVCTPNTVTATWTVNPLPTASISGTTPACQSTVLTATTNAGDPIYQWYLDGDAIPEADGSTYEAFESGNYTVVVIDDETGCSFESNEFAVQIDANPTQYNVTGGPFCGGANIFVGLSGSQNGYAYNLKFAGNTVSTQNGNGGALTFNVNPAQVGTYTIEAVNGTCTQAMNGSITVNPAPTAFAGADAFTCGTTGYTVNDATATNYASVSWGHSGLGSISNGNTLAPTYTPAAGDIGNTVTLTLTVNALNGCVNTGDAMLLQVRSNPNTSISASGPLSFCQGGSVTLTAAENDATYQWREDGDAIIGETNQSLFVNTSGNYTVTVTKNGCSVTTSEATVVTVNPNPSITTNATNQERCGTGNVTFTAATTSLNSVVDWSATNDFASFTSGNNKTVSVTAGNTDTYYYRARNTVTGCVSGTLSVTGTAYTVPTPTISGNSTVGLNTNLTLTTQSGKSGYSWSVDGGSITSGDGTYQIAVQWASAGTKNVTVTYSENGCPGTSATFEVTVSAEAAPVITGNPSNATKCSNDANATFSVTSVSGVPAPTLEWQVNDGEGWVAATGADYSGGNTTELTVTNLSGKNGYQYKLFATNGINPDDYSDPATLTLTAAQTPGVTIASDDLDNTFCSGTNVTFTATPFDIGDGTVAYQWKLNGGNVGSNSATYSNNSLVTNDQVSCVITITGGCVTTTTANSNTITNTVLQITQISQHPQSTIVDEGDDHTFTVTASGDNLTYTWYKAPNTQVGNGSSLELTDIEASDAGNYYVIVSGTCGNVQSNNATLTVQQPAVKLAIDNIGTQTDGTQFTITVRSLNSSNVATNVTQNTGFEITVETGTGTIGTVTGTINNGSSSTTVNVTYNKTGGETGVSLKATRTSGMNLTAGTSNTFTVRAAEPTTQASAIQFLEIGSNYVKIKWTNGSGSNRIVLCELGNASGLTEVPTDGTGYTANTTFGSGSPIGGAYVVSDTDKDTVSIFGLTYNSTYAFKVIEYNGSGSSANYKTNGFGTSNPRQRKIDGKESINESTTIVLGEHFILTGITPNPATSDVNFKVIANEAMDANIEIVNELGVVVHSFSKSLTIGEHPFSLKLGTEKGGLPSGTYLLRVTAGGESLIQKFIYMP